MKKIILSAAFLTFAAFSTVKANSIEYTAIQASSQDSTQSREVKIDELPEPVKTTLASDAYKDWTPVSATWSKSKDGEFYQIILKKGEEQGSLKIDPAGKVIQ